MNPTPESLSREFTERFPAAPPPAPPADPAALPAAPPAPAPAPASPPPSITPPACAVTDFAVRGVHLDAVVAPDQVVAAAQWLGGHGFALDAITGLDWIAQGQMELVYDYFHPQSGLRVAVRARVPRETPELPTISAVFQGADWHERETHDFFGIRFSGHPNLAPFLLPEDATFHPLRKDYAP